MKLAAINGSPCKNWNTAALLQKVLEGAVSTLAGSGERGYADGTGAEAQFDLPFRVAVDGVGSVYVADNCNNRIRKITITTP